MLDIKAIFSKVDRRLLAGILVALLFLCLWIANAALSKYVIFIVSLIGVYIVAAESLNLTNGYTGLFSLGHAGFMAVGAYTSALLTFPVKGREMFVIPKLPIFLGGPEAAWPFLPALIMGGIFAAVIAAAVGLPVLRLRGHYLSVASLGLMVLIAALAMNLRDLTRGSIGINSIPTYTNVWWAYVSAVLTVYVVWRIVKSSFGRAMKAIREDEIAARVQGINPLKYKLLSFTIGAFFAGIAGGLYAHLSGAIRPYAFSFNMTFQIVIMVVLGGQGTIAGPVVGATIITILRYVMKPLEEALGIYGLVELVYATLLIVTMLRKPEGLLGRRRISKKAEAP
ncbi:MAG TPA: branched-chain amino acid ABC transporter permease [Spirochaetota bacterium]|nr:branched-chain amino acid ABC transporter permease [Spirochaetota bacterium]